MKHRLLCLLLLPILLLAACQGGAPTEGDTTMPFTEGISEPITEAHTDALTEPMMDEPSEYLDTTVDTFDDLLIHGRTLPIEQGRLVLEWSWSGFTMRGWFDGPIVANCQANAPLGVLLHVEVDGKDTLLPPLATGEQVVTLAEVERGYHTVIVRKTSEGSSGTLTLRALRFTGVLDTAPNVPSLTVEIIGDSITNGVGSYPEAVTDWNPLLQSDSYYAYSTMLGRALDAEVRLVSLSGWGVTRGSTAAEHRVPDIYHLASPLTDSATSWDFTKNQPDVVVISLGTNDMGTPSDAFIAAAMDFLKTVREKNPDAYIIWMYGMMDSTFSTVLRTEIRRLGDDRIVYLRTSKSQSGGWGHPSYEAQCDFAEALTELLASIVRKES